MVELLNGVASKEESCSSRAHVPASYFVWVRPHEVTHRSVMWYFLLAVYCHNFVESADDWRKSAMYAKNAVIDECRQSKVVKDFSAVSPNID